LVGFSLDSDEFQASQTPLFSTRASRSIPDPEYLLALLSPLEQQIIQGRINALQKQIKKQRDELIKIEQELTRRK
jgi:hypothetical protein